MIKDLKDKAAKLYLRYPYLFDKPVKVSLLKEVDEKIPKNVANIATITYSDSDMFRYSFLSLVLRESRLTQVSKINCYELVDTFLGNKEDKHSMFDFSAPVLVIESDGTEMANVRLPEFIIQVMGIQKSQGNKCYFLCKKSPIRDYTQVYSYVEEFKGNNINLSIGQAVSKNKPRSDIF